MDIKTGSIPFLFVLFMAVVMISCRSESDEFTQVEDNQSLRANSKAANLISRVLMNDKNDDDDDDIECINFQYPFSASAFDIERELITTITFENDNDLNQFIEGLKEEDIVAIRFPILLIIAEKTEIEVDDLDDLVETIEDYIDIDCDDDDD